MSLKNKITEILFKGTEPEISKVGISFIVTIGLSIILANWRLISPLTSFEIVMLTFVVTMCGVAYMYSIRHVNGYPSVTQLFFILALLASTTNNAFIQSRGVTFCYGMGISIYFVCLLTDYIYGLSARY